MTFENPGDKPSYEMVYDVHGYVAHRHDASVPAAVGMRGGHYVAYMLHGGDWYEADDAVVKKLAAPPSAFPYLVFLAQSQSGPNIGAKRHAQEGVSESTLHARIIN